MTTPVTQYSIEKHKHMYAKWCAAAAYGRGLAGGNNSLAFELIEVSGLGEVTGPEHIGQNVDEWQMSFMKKIETEAVRLGVGDFSFGRAQKLVNIYLKTVLVCGGHHQHPGVALLHPPLDFELFKGLRSFLWKNRAAMREAWSAFNSAQKRNPRWTTFSETDYVAHIDAIKLLMAGKPLYQVEEYWDLSR
ncbi:hypothetical protein BLA18112_02068 [Burkholderia lata]|uniref:Uncharacterized protein n=1 Tax=Burkholderia lata (strain ATCC 17760 / DSM 23089 / LMG 22485 / NCIMB 9086 / R18194 / 383) TaxID=482957 RepID=A0A6P2UVJ4_BURL3|nr:hypothetical protein [Burkholderia lata]VWC72779.1 hypothetical protein BLA18112_02068 [Burkholderia lata]